jgi:Domain of unknown function (DUF4249)
LHTVLNFKTKLNFFKMKIIKYSLIFGLFAGFSACDVEEYFSPVVELKMPPHTSKLVVAADFGLNSDSLRVFVSKSYAFLDPKLPANSFWWNADTVTGVQVKLFKNNLLWANLTSAQNGYYTSGQKIALNDTSTYRLEVSAPQYETVTAVQKAPAKVPMLNSMFTANGGADRDGRKIDLYSIEFKDPANEENFYQAEATLKHKDWNGQWEIVTFPLNHFAAASDNGGENMLTDKAFNGKAYRWLLQGSYSRIFP